MLGSLAFLIGVRAQGLTVALGALVAILCAAQLTRAGCGCSSVDSCRRSLFSGRRRSASQPRAGSVSLCRRARTTSSSIHLARSAPSSSGRLESRTVRVSARSRRAGGSTRRPRRNAAPRGASACPLERGGHDRPGSQPARVSRVALGEPIRLASPARAKPVLHNTTPAHLRRILAVARNGAALLAFDGVRRGVRGARVGLAPEAHRDGEQRRRSLRVLSPGAQCPEPLGIPPRVADPPRRLGAGTFLIAKRPVFPIFTVVLAFAAVTAGVNYTDTLNSDQVHALAWVDHALPAGASANLVYLGGRYQACNPTAGEQEGLTVWTEWFNTHVTGVDYVETADPADGLPPPTKLVVGRGGVVLRSGKPFAPVYAIVDSRQPIVGKRLGRFDYSRLAPSERGAAALTLWRVEPPLRFKLLPRAAPGGVRGRGANLIPNGEFDAGVDGWAGNAGTERIRTEKTRRPKALTGNSMSVRVAGNRFSGVFYSPAIPIKKNASYVFSFYVKGKAGQTILPTLEWSSTGSAPPTTTDQPTGTPLTGSWQLIVFYEVPPPGAVAVTPAIVLSGTPHTSFNVDSVRLARGSASTRGLCAG